jgi:hypothetical protein
MKNRDEDYVINICDRVLNQTSTRQHRFDFLRGDPVRNGGLGRKLPVDAYYGSLKLVIEYRERQHAESIPFFDKPERLTCSGCARDEQRRRYDKRRQDFLNQHGIKLVALYYTMFRCNASRRLWRDEEADKAVIRQRLSEYLPPPSKSARNAV